MDGGRQGAKRGLRDNIERGAQLLGLALDEHIQCVIVAMQGIARELGLAPGQVKDS